MVALPCEAQPFVERYGLKRVKCGLPFRVWLHDGLLVAAAGIGRSSMARAPELLWGKFDCSNTFWLNVGIAGHGHQAIGLWYRVSQVRNTCGDVMELADEPPTPGFDPKPCFTVDDVETEFAHDALYDMEGFAFVESVLQYAPRHRVFCFKVISDNKDSGFDYLDRHTISDLVRTGLDSLENQLFRPLSTW